MERIYQVIQKHRLTFEELMLCFDATYKHEKAEEYKALYKKYKAFDPEFVMPKIQGTNEYFYECSFIENCLFHLFPDKDVTIQKIVSRTEGKNSVPNTPENVFFYFLIKQLTIEPRSLNYPQPLFRFLPKKFKANVGTNIISDAETARTLFRVIRANENCCNDSLPAFERKVYGDDLRKSIAVYLELYKDKKITATIEALKAHELHCQLLSKFIEYSWENLDKIEDDFKYLISFIHALKLHIFVISEGERLRLRKENNKIFPSIFMGNQIYDGALKEFKAKVEYMNVLQQITSHPKQAHLGLYNDFETIEELVVRCAVFFSVHKEEKINPQEVDLLGDFDFQQGNQIEIKQEEVNQEEEKVNIPDDVFQQQKTNILDLYDLIPNGIFEKEEFIEIKQKKDNLDIKKKKKFETSSENDSASDVDNSNRPVIPNKKFDTDSSEDNHSEKSENFVTADEH